MAAKIGRPRKPEATTPIRLPESMAEKIRLIAVRAKLDAGDWIAAEFRAAVDQKYRDIFGSKSK